MQSISAEPLLEKLLSGVTKTATDVVGNAVKIVDDTVDTVSDVVASLPKILTGLLQSVTKVTQKLPTGVGSLGGILNQLGGLLSGLLSNLINTVNSLVDALLGVGGSAVVGGTLTNVERALIKLIQAVSIVITSSSKLTGNVGRLLDAVDEIVSELTGTLKGFIGAVVGVVANLIGKITKAVLKSLLLLLKTIVAIVVEILASLLAVLTKRGLTLSNLVTGITSQLSAIISSVTDLLKGTKNGDAVVSSLTNILEPPSNTEPAKVVAGSVTSLLITATSKLEQLNVENLTPIPTYIFEAAIGAVNKIFDGIDKALAPVAKIVSQVTGLVDVAITNVKASIGVVLQLIGSITLNNLAAAANHLNAASVQLLATVQTIIDALVFLANNVLLDANVANVLEAIVKVVLYVIKIVVAVINELLVLLVDVVENDVTDITGILSDALGEITSGLSDALDDILKTLGDAVEGLTKGDGDVVVGTLSSVGGSLPGVSGTFTGTLTGLTGILSSLGKNLFGGGC